jgi:dTMP kinase
VLIVLEGAEGVGKTTQLSLLAERIRARGIDVMTLREPGGTPLGDAIRQILLDPSQHIVPEAETLLFLASRAQIVRTEIDPALARGVVVLMDRFFLSTYAYQIVGRGLDEESIRAANATATGGRTPDLTIVLQLAAAEGLARASERSGHDRIEGSGKEFHERVEGAFSMFADGDWQRRHPECGQIVVVDGEGTPDEVHERIVDALARNLPSRFGHISGAHTG